MGRVVSVLAGLRDVPGTHDHPVLLVVAADHPHGRARDQGRRGRRVHRRRGRVREPVQARATPTAGPTPRTRSSRTPGCAARSAPRAARARGRRPTGSPTSTSRWARRPRTSPSSRTSRARRWTSSRPCRRTARSQAQESGLLRARDHARHAARRHRGQQGRRPAARHDGREARAAEAGVPPDGKVTAGNACPLNDGAAAVVVMSDTRASELGITPLARIVSSGVTALNPEIMGLGPIEASRQALGRAGMTIDDIDLVEINEAFAAQVIPSARHLGDRLGQAQRQRRRDRARPPVRHDRRPHHDDAAQRPRGRRQDDRPRDDVRRRRPGHGHDRRAPQLTT